MREQSLTGVACGAGKVQTSVPAMRNGTGFDLLKKTLGWKIKPWNQYVGWMC